MKQRTIADATLLNSYKIYQSWVYSGTEHIFCSLCITMLQIWLFCQLETKYFDAEITCIVSELELHE